MTSTDTVLITGASGLVGQLTAAILLVRHPGLRLFLPVRGHHDIDELRASMIDHALQLDGSAEIDPERLLIEHASAEEGFEPRFERLRDLGVTEIIHALGSLAYDDPETLNRINVDLTAHIVDVAKRLNVRRLIYVSTAFSCGMGREEIEETLHPEPEFDPTEYTRTKRVAERIVMESGVPSVIVRPSIVVGRCADGVYTGRPYGIYQLMFMARKFMRDIESRSVYAVAPRTPLQTIHQDHFQEAMERVFRLARPGEIYHLVSEYESLVTSRQLIEHWIQRYLRPETVHLYDSLSDFPLDSPEVADFQKMFLEATAVNNEIAGHQLNFRSNRLRALYGPGEHPPRVSLESMNRCIDWYMGALD